VRAGEPQFPRPPPRTPLPIPYLEGLGEGGKGLWPLAPSPNKIFSGQELGSKEGAGDKRKGERVSKGPGSKWGD